MTAKDLYNALCLVINPDDIPETYFATYEELNQVITGAQYPCLVCVPIGKTQAFTVQGITNVEQAVFALLDEMPLDFKTEDIYDSVSALEHTLEDLIYPYASNITALQNISELCKFDENLMFAGMAVTLTDKRSICAQ